MATSAYARTEVEFWHAFAGRPGKLVMEQVEPFNAGQCDHVVVQSPKGNHTEALNAGIAVNRQPLPASKIAPPGAELARRCVVSL